MDTISEIEEAIVRLKADELIRVRKWFEEFDIRAWDGEFERDSGFGLEATLITIR
jgi:hypothetical protein